MGPVQPHLDTGGEDQVKIAKKYWRDHAMKSDRVCVVFLLLAATTLAQTQSYIISTYAGGAPPPTPSPALHMWIGYPQFLAADAAGNIYFSTDYDASFQ